MLNELLQHNNTNRRLENKTNLIKKNRLDNTLEIG